MEMSKEGGGATHKLRVLNSFESELLLGCDPENRGICVVREVNPICERVKACYRDWAQNVHRDFRCVGIIILQLMLHSAFDRTEWLRLLNIDFVNTSTRMTSPFRATEPREHLSTIFQKSAKCGSDSNIVSDPKPLRLAEIESPDEGGQCAVDTPALNVSSSLANFRGINRHKVTKSEPELILTPRQKVENALCVQYPAIHTLHSHVKEFLFLAFMPFEDGELGQGVYYRVEFLVVVLRSIGPSLLSYMPIPHLSILCAHIQNIILSV
jgi:hypothetical protein